MKLPQFSVSSSQDSVIFACGLLLPPVQALRAISLSNDIAAHNQVKFTLNQTHQPPSVRLYETVFPKASVAMAEAFLQSTCDGMGRFQMSWGIIESTEHFVSIWGELNAELDVFHKSVLYGLNEFRTGYFKDKYIEEEEHELLTNEEKDSLQKWGSPWAEPYLPHMIISKATSTYADQKKALKWDFEHCLFRGLVMGVKTNSGTFEHISTIDFLDVQVELPAKEPSPKTDPGYQHTEEIQETALKKLIGSNRLGE